MLKYHHFMVNFEQKGVPIFSERPLPKESGQLAQTLNQRKRLPASWTLSSARTLPYRR